MSAGTFYTGWGTRDITHARDLMSERIMRKLRDVIAEIEGRPQTDEEILTHCRGVFFEAHSSMCYTWKGKQVLMIGKPEVSPTGAFVVPMWACGMDLASDL